MRNKTRNNRIGILASFALSAALILSSCATPAEFNDNLPDLSERFSTKDAVTEAIAMLSAKNAKAQVLSGVNTIRKVAFLSFDGLSDEATTKRLLMLLDIFKVNASFFLPGIKSAEDPVTVVKIADAGHHIGNYTLNATTRMEKMTAESLTENIASTNAVLSDITGIAPEIVKCRATNYTDTVLRAAGSAGIPYALESTHLLSYQSFQTAEDAHNYVLGLQRGAVISVNVDSVLNEDEYEVSIISESYDRQPGVIWDYENEKDRSREDKLILVVRYLLEALTAEGFVILPVSAIPEHVDPDFAQSFTDLQADNNGAKSAVFANARTTMRSVALSFRYIHDGDRLDRVLDALKAANITATFYVTGREIDDHPERIERIIEAGHALENGGMTGDDLSSADFTEVSLEIYKCGKMLSELYGIDSTLFMPPGGKITDVILEAAHAQDYAVASYNKNPVAQGIVDTQGLASYFSNGVNRGDVIFGDLERFEGWDLFIPYISNTVRWTGYNFTTAAQMYASQYPLYSISSIPGSNLIYANSNFDPAIPRENDFIDGINTTDKVIFLTFDDWGSDRTVTALLDTLSLYGAKAAFFVRANGVEQNPNLARAIYEQGHDVLSHSYAHQAIVDISTQELQADAVKAHQILTQTLGKAPALIYRPPTLEYDNRALNALFASGYKYLLSGNPSTHDYEKSAQEVIDMVLQAARPGCVPILHMSDNACAREAINVIIPTLQAQGYKFARVSDYLKG